MDGFQDRRHILADSLSYLSHEGLYAFLPKKERTFQGFCDACFTGRYPIPPDDTPSRQLHLFEARDR